MSALRLATEILKRNGTISGIVSNRIYPLVAPQGATLPYLVLDLVHEGDFHTLQGSGQWFDSRFSVSSYAGSAEGANSLAERCKPAMDWSGVIYEEGSPATRIGEAQVMKDGADIFDWSEDREVFRRVTDYSMIWRA